VLWRGEWQRRRRHTPKARERFNRANGRPCDAHWMPNDPHLIHKDICAPLPLHAGPFQHCRRGASREIEARMPSPQHATLHRRHRAYKTETHLLLPTIRPAAGPLAALSLRIQRKHGDFQQWSAAFNALGLLPILIAFYTSKSCNGCAPGCPTHAHAPLAAHHPPSTLTELLSAFLLSAGFKSARKAVRMTRKREGRAV